jgi:putative exporter of polyketide antibiotics
MKAFRIIMRVISLTLLASTVICGLYISSNGAALSDYAGSVRFHMAIGVAALVFCAVTMFLPGGKGAGKQIRSNSNAA